MRMSFRTPSKGKMNLRWWFRLLFLPETFLLPQCRAELFGRELSLLGAWFAKEIQITFF